MAQSHAQAVISPFATPYPQQANSIYSWEQLRDVFVLNFRCTYEEPKMQQHLLGIRQRLGESIREYMRRFSQARCQVQDITEASVINAASASLLESELTRKIANKELQTLEHLLHIIDGFVRGEEDSKRRQAMQAEYDKASVAAAQAQAQVQIAEPPPLTVRQPQPAIQGQPSRQGQAPMTWRKFRTDRAGKAVMTVEEVQALRKEFDAQEASNHQQPARKKARKDLYCAFHRRSSHTTEQCRNIRQRGNEQDSRPQQGAAVEAPREVAQEQAPPAEQRQDAQRRVIQVITRADPPIQLSKRQKKMQLRTIHNITSAGEGSPQYLNQQISFGPEDAEGVMFPHQDPLASAEKQFKLMIAFGSGENRREEQVLFDVVDIPYSYNAIFGRATLNKFEAISHHNYLKLKMPGPKGVIVVKGLQLSPASKCVLAIIKRAVRNVEAEPHDRAKHASKPAPHGKIVKMQIDDADPTKLVSLGGDMGEEEAKNILEVLKKNIDIFAWGPDEVGGVSADLIMHHLAVKPDAKPRKQKLCKILKQSMSEGQFPLATNRPARGFDSRLQLMSFLDAYSGYYQIRMNPADIPKTAIITPFGTFCHLRMPFGLRNAGATFARLVYKVLFKQLGRNVEAYVDDIVVKSRKAFDHASDLQETFDNLRAAGMKLNPEKCIFGVRTGKLLGFLVSERGIEANPEKIDAIQQMKPPSSVREVQKLAGRIVALSRFLSKAAKRAEYEAILLFLRKAKALRVRRMLIRTDSKLVEGHVDKSFEAKEEGMKRYLEAVRSLEKCFTGITVEHLPRGQNEEADALAKSAAYGGPHSPGIFFEALYAPSVPMDSLEVMAIDQVKLGEDPYVWVLQPLLRCISFAEGEEMAKEIHQGLCGTHQAARTVASKVFRQGVYWPTVLKVCVEQIKKCESCQRHGRSQTAPQYELQPIAPIWPFARWGLDIIRPPNPLGTITSAAVQKFVWKNIVCPFGVPKEFITDNGKQFDSDKFREMCEGLNLDIRFASVAHPQSNGAAERTNGKILEALKKRLEGGNEGQMARINAICSLGPSNDPHKTNQVQPVHASLWR
uniref:Retroelement polyprotein n=1 Tax=Oryza sativa subsp. japonica TaxID=39947 RepID=Q6F2X0_ORYSJ|nr:putative retroelement polyprotein [Oryza sativa Japonica Group]